MKNGKVFLVGAGPGDVGLITLKAVHCLHVANVVVYDHLVNPELLSFAPKSARRIFAGKYPQNHILFQKEINRLLVQTAKKGNIVVRLKGGDPLLFGRGAEEALELAEAGVPFEIVPGVSSSYAVPAYAGIPVTYRNISSRLNIVTGHEAPEKGRATIDWKKQVDDHATLVILMGFANLEKIVREVTADRKRRTMPVAVISNGTCRDQKVVTGTLADIVGRVKDAGIKAPAIIVIGRVVALREKLDWFKPEPALKGKRILVTRPAHQASALVDLLKTHGATVISVPLIKVVPSGKTAEIKARLEALDLYSWLIFTSANGVDIFMKQMHRARISPERLQGKKIAAIGQKTASYLKDLGLPVSLVPAEFVQEALADEVIRAVGKRSQRILLVHALGSRPVLEQKLRSARLDLDTLDLYRSVPLIVNYGRIRRLFEGRKIDAVMLTSSSCVDSFVRAFAPRKLKALTKNVITAVIGPVSAATARKAGLPVTVESKEYTIEGVTRALVDHYQERKTA
ncbi:MAG: uroporphyrinogen-III C-methyltransferase [Candidatus Omnitrophica bacterium]|nr:uroporphyrinogen-III C-methyltransferase [Candidatus Omnitrophota bacterium]